MENYPGEVRPNTEQVHFAEGDDRAYLLTPMFTMVRSSGSGDTATSAVKSHYPDDSEWYIVTIATGRGGKLVRVEQYFAPVYEAPAWREAWVERMSEPPVG